jgi:cytochrome P450
MTDSLRAPGPRGLPVLGSMIDWRNHPIDFMLRVRDEYGGVARLQLGPITMHILSDPEAVSRVLTTNNKNYRRGAIYEQFKLFMGKGLLTTDGDDWRDHRRAISPVFLKNALAPVVPSVVAATNQMLDEWEEKAKTGQPVDLMAEMMRLTLLTLSQALFSYDITPSVPQLKDIVDVGIDIMFKHGYISEMMPPWMPTGRNRTVKKNRAYLYQMAADIRARHVSTGQGQLMDLMEGARYPGTERGWTDAEIRDEILTIYLAGHETTATGLFWTLASVADEPEVQGRLDEEISRVLGDAPPDGATAEGLDYARMVVDESLRLHPPIWGYPRDAIKADTVCGYEIPAGSSLLLSPLAAQRNPEFWPDPDKFIPERFTAEAVKARPRFAYFPFGGGARMCVGNVMALLEMRIVIAMVNQRFRLSLSSARYPRYGDSLISLRPDDVLVHLHSRRQSAAMISA